MDEAPPLVLTGPKAFRKRRQEYLCRRYFEASHILSALRKDQKHKAKRTQSAFQRNRAARKRQLAQSSSSRSRPAKKKNGAGNARGQDRRVRRSGLKGTSLTTNYLIPKGSLAQAEWKEHRKKLTFTPYNSFAARNPFAKKDPPIKCWAETANFYVVPGPYGSFWFGQPENDLQEPGEPLDKYVECAVRLWGADQDFDQESTLGYVYEFRRTGLSSSATADEEAMSAAAKRSKRVRKTKPCAAPPAVALLSSSSSSSSSDEREREEQDRRRQRAAAAAAAAAAAETQAMRKRHDELRALAHRDHAANPRLGGVPAFRRGCMFVAPTSAGKTVMVCHLIKQLNLKTLVVVPCSTVFNQWPSRIEKFLPGSRVGLVRGRKRHEVGVEYDVSVAMLKSLVVCSEHYPKDFLKGVGLVIFDEVHTVSTKLYSEAIRHVLGGVPNKIGITATLKRKDKMENLLRCTIGPVVHAASPVTTASLATFVAPVLYRGGVQLSFQNSNGDPDYPKMLTTLSDDALRTRTLYHIVRELVKKGRRVVVLCDRVKLCEDLFEMTRGWRYGDEGRDLAGKRVFHYKSSTKSDKRSEVDSQPHDLLFACYGLFGLGTDVTYLDTIVMGTGRSEIEQAAGRLRCKCSFDIERHPLLVVDFVDDFGMFSAQFTGARRRLYRKKKFTVMEPAVLGALECDLACRGIVGDKIVYDALKMSEDLAEERESTQRCSERCVSLVNDMSKSIEDSVAEKKCMQEYFR